MAGMRFKKIKITNDDKIHIAYERQNSRGGWNEFTLTCAEEPYPDFYQAMNALAADVVEICELPESYVERITMRGVSISHSGDAEVMGATITAQMRLEHSNVPLNLNTPHKIEEPYGDNVDHNALLPGNCAMHLYLLFEQARKYVDGDRPQQDLFRQAEAEQAVEEQIPENAPVA